MVEEKPYYQVCLREELARRSERNPRYSLRAFASSLEVDPGALSRILSGKQILALKSARRILSRLELSPLEQERFLRSAAEEKGRASLKSVGLPEAATALVEIDPDTFRVIGELYHYAILELTQTENLEPGVRPIAKRLGITTLEAKLAVERLCRLGLLKKERGRFAKTAASLSVRNKEATAPALKRQQRQILHRALGALDEVPLDKRVANSITMAVDPAKIPVARRLIVEFSRSLCELLENGRRQKVYQMHVSLFPLEKETSP